MKENKKWWEKRKTYLMKKEKKNNDEEVKKKTDENSGYEEYEDRKISSHLHHHQHDEPKPTSRDPYIYYDNITVNTGATGRDSVILSKITPGLEIGGVENVVFDIYTNRP